MFSICFSISSTKINPRNFYIHLLAHHSISSQKLQDVLYNSEFSWFYSVPPVIIPECVFRIGLCSIPLSFFSNHYSLNVLINGQTQIKTRSTKKTLRSTNKADVNTRWFKYDRDKLWLVYTQIVPVIFEPPCNFCCYCIKVFCVYPASFFRQGPTFRDCSCVPSSGSQCDPWCWDTQAIPKRWSLTKQWRRAKTQNLLYKKPRGLQSDNLWSCLEKVQTHAVRKSIYVYRSNTSGWSKRNFHCNNLV